MIKAALEVRARETTRGLLAELFGEHAACSFAVQFWDGTLWTSQDERAPDFTIVLRHPGSLRKMFEGWSDVKFGEAYIYDDFDIQGDAEAFARLAWELVERRWNWRFKLRMLRRLLRLPADHPARAGRGAARLKGNVHSLERDRHAVAYHYDLSNDFYALWLDRRMVYSCAYFVSPDDDLDTAQQRKLHYICRKLRLQRDERLLDIGCGWGGLILHAAEHFGVQATGITLSRAQHEWAQERIRSLGLQDRCRVLLRDYRELDEPGRYDKLASVGMCEHVGRAKLPNYFGQAWRLLRPGGVFLNHGIVRSAVVREPTEATFVQKYVFPDGDLQRLHDVLKAAEHERFEVRDVESLREHYALTLRHWVKRLEELHDRACEVAGEVAYRIWRMFMATSAHGFTSGRLNIYQTLLVKPDGGDSQLPLTRGDLYGEPAS